MPDEILVIDDGSTDNTQAVLERFAHRSRVAASEPRWSAARNTGIREATSDAVLFLDSDDLLLPNAIEEFVSVLEERPDVDVVYANAKMIDAEGRLIAIYADRMPGARPSGNIWASWRGMLPNDLLEARRSAAQNIRFEEGMEFGEDYDFWRQLAAKSNFAYIDQLLTCYRFHKGMTIVSVGKNMDASGSPAARAEMPEFAQLSRRERACAYAARSCEASHGTTAR